MPKWAIQCKAESPPFRSLRISPESKEHDPIGHFASYLAPLLSAFYSSISSPSHLLNSTPPEEERPTQKAQSSKLKAQPPSMAATVSTMAMLNAKCLATCSASQPKLNPTKPSLKPTFLNLPAGLLSSASASSPKPAHTLAGSAIAGAVFSALSHADSAFAAQQIAELAEGDNRGLALLLPIIPAIAWVLFNILQPALNQINRMRSSKGVIVGLGLGGLVGYGFGAQDAAAAELAAIAEASGSDNRGQLLLFVVAPAILWVLYNILQPALNQINRMRSR
ncbi:hypothetical protein ACJRO7_012634 [Eucalyptus globulus]|uniref:Photosystem II core complex proteins psbY, chloroplastic n=1 Tax=Eucalyptus globulus TaxID=34317 RepID=A0ABD3LJ69_EUCGL